MRTNIYYERLTKDFITHQYIILGKSSDKIGKEFNIPKTSVWNALRRFSIVTRSIRDSRQNKESKQIPGYQWCNSCKTDKTFDNFVKNNLMWRKIHSVCKNCTAIKAKKYVPTMNKNRQRHKVKLILEFGNKCHDCEIEDLPISAFVFHHHSEKMNDKNYISPSDVISSKNGALITREKTKWILLCANCHSVRHSTYKLSATKFPQ